MTNSSALISAFERADGICECIGGGCPALTHRPGVNRCFGPLRSLEMTFFYTVARFVDRSNPENIEAICGSCAASPRKNSERIIAPSIAPVRSSADVARDEGTP